MTVSVQPEHEGTSGVTIFISAGEASGERYGALLIDAVRRMQPDARFFGLGGALMAAAGCERLVATEEIAVMGITEVILHMPRIYGAYRRLVRGMEARRPDVAVLIDFPDVNLRLARELKRLGIPVIYFVSPQLWAWKKRRIRWVRERVDKMLVIFPFEREYYRERGVDAEFVGHPLADLPLPSMTRNAFADAFRIDPSKEWIGLLPGSRAKEVRLNLPAMAAAASLLGGRYEYLVPAATTLDADWIRSQVQRCRASVPIHVVEDARAVLLHARASIVASGTATVEAALMGNPFISVYRLSALSYAVASKLVKVPHVAMVNLVAGKRIVPELIQDEFTPENVICELKPLLQEGPARSQMLRELGEIRQMLRAKTDPSNPDDPSNAGAINRAAEWVLHFLPNPHPIQG